MIRRLIFVQLSLSESGRSWHEDCIRCYILWRSKIWQDEQTTHLVRPKADKIDFLAQSIAKQCMHIRVGSSNQPRTKYHPSAPSHWDLHRFLGWRTSLGQIHLKLLFQKWFQPHTEREQCIPAYKIFSSAKQSKHRLHTNCVQLHSIFSLDCARCVYKHSNPKKLVCIQLVTINTAIPASAAFELL